MFRKVPFLHIVLTVCAFLIGCETTIYRDEQGNEILGPETSCPSSALAWSNVGFEDGYCGNGSSFKQPELLSTRYSLACSAKGLTVDYGSYLAGVRKGSAHYCTPNGAHWLGRAGRDFERSRCRQRTEWDLWRLSEAYHDGRDAREIEEDIQDVYLSEHGRVSNSGGVYGTFQPPLPENEQDRVDSYISEFGNLDRYGSAKADCEYY